MSDLRPVIRVIEEFRRLDEEMPAQQMLTFLYVAQKEGLQMRELQDLLGVASSSTSRNVAALSKRHSRDREGHGLLEAKEDPNDMRYKTVHMTPKGRKFLSNITHWLKD